MNCCFAQEPYFRHFGVEQGLPSSEVHDILQDRNGFIWIATDRGVSKYDGYSFHNFSSAYGLTDNTVFYLTEDTTGNIWCGTLNRKLCYFSGEKIVPYTHNAILKNQSQSNLMQSLNITSSGDVLVGSRRSGCIQIDRMGKNTNLFSLKRDTAIHYEVSNPPPQSSTFVSPAPRMISHANFVWLFFYLFAENHATRSKFKDQF